MHSMLKQCSCRALEGCSQHAALSSSWQHVTLADAVPAAGADSTHAAAQHLVPAHPGWSSALDTAAAQCHSISHWGSAVRSKWTSTRSSSAAGAGGVTAVAA